MNRVNWWSTESLIALVTIRTNRFIVSWKWITYYRKASIIDTIIFAFSFNYLYHLLRKLSLLYSYLQTRHPFIVEIGYPNKLLIVNIDRLLIDNSSLFTEKIQSLMIQQYLEYKKNDEERENWSIFGNFQFYIFRC